MQITVIGTGFVGVVSAAVYSSLGHTVFGLDIDQAKIESLQQSKVPFFEPQLEELLVEQQNKGTLFFTTSYQEAVPKSDLIIVAVGTPSKPNGEANLEYVYSVIDAIAPQLKQESIIAIKSTVPPGTFIELEQRLQAKTSNRFHLVSLPEFLKEGSAVADALHPDRVVIGTQDSGVAKTLRQLHAPLRAPIVVVSPESAQMGKYAANAYLATRITFINEIANLCEQTSSDIEEVIQVFGHDRRIGLHYWYPGFGYGGSCFPKDVKELSHSSEQLGDSFNLFSYLVARNTNRIEKLLQSFKQDVGSFQEKQVAVLGLSFKPLTNDTREAPALKIIPWLLQQGAVVTCYDPQAVYPTGDGKRVVQASSISEVCHNADAIIAVIEWPEIISFDYKTVRNTDKQQYFFDARNQFSAEKMRQLGFLYRGVGRSLDAQE